MSAKEAALDVINQLPSDVSWGEIHGRLEFVAAVEEGLVSCNEQGTELNEAKALVSKWAGLSGRS